VCLTTVNMFPEVEFLKISEKWPKPLLFEKLFTKDLEQWLKRYLFSTGWNNCWCAVHVHWVVDQCGSAAISEYKSSKISQMAAMGRKDNFQLIKLLFLFPEVELLNISDKMTENPTFWKTCFSSMFLNNGWKGILSAQAKTTADALCMFIGLKTNVDQLPSQSTRVQKFPNWQLCWKSSFIALYTSSLVHEFCTPDPCQLYVVCHDYPLALRQDYILVIKTQST
jgi:hypothetical protein